MILRSNISFGIFLTLFCFGVGLGLFQNCAKINYKGSSNKLEGITANLNLIDSDLDGLPDDVENTIGTNPNDADTDKDGLQDGAEATVHMTDPLDADTDKGGVKDGAEVSRGSNPLNPVDDYPTNSNQDSDNDGLTDSKEIQIGTDPNDADSDDDGLKDGAEINTYRTNPLNPDTDKGGVKDGEEIFQGTNPLDPKDDYEDECEVIQSPNGKIRFSCPARNRYCNNGSGNGAETCSPSPNGNNDERP